MMMFSQDEFSIFLNRPNHDKESGPWVQSLMDKTFFQSHFALPEGESHYMREKSQVTRSRVEVLGNA